MTSFCYRKKISSCFWPSFKVPKMLATLPCSGGDSISFRTVQESSTDFRANEVFLWIYEGRNLRIIFAHFLLLLLANRRWKLPRNYTKGNFSNNYFQTLIRGAQNGHPCGARIIVILVCKTISFVVGKKMLKKQSFKVRMLTIQMKYILKSGMKLPI